ncbi:hypothetical protein [Legionella oakridgensis]|uniref:hypothetical protein n=1 Tax=Legionella oakridgensis TaxID=29423 RepID=UPI0011C440A9|nr:hypothetical protein [Legionella oakridgensis]
MLTRQVIRTEGEQVSSSASPGLEASAEPVSASLAGPSQPKAILIAVSDGFGGYGDFYLP